MKSTITSRPFLVLFCAASLLYACKKDNDEAPTPPPKPKPVTERILGTWNIIKESEARYAYTTNAFLDSNSVAIGTGLFTVEFRTDGKMYVMTNNNGINRDTLPYSFTADTTLVTINGDPYLFKQFTDSNLVTLDIYDDGSANVKHYLQFKK